MWIAGAEMNIVLSISQPPRRTDEFCSPTSSMLGPVRTGNLVLERGKSKTMARTSGELGHWSAWSSTSSTWR